jgi:hypothetical protein
MKKNMATSKNFGDVTDSKRDQERLQQDDTTLNLPDVKDIPGQENIRIPDFKEMADTTISSDDEEGLGLFNDTDNDPSNERIGSAQEISEDDLIIDADEDESEELLDEEDDVEYDDDDLEITDDSIDPESDVSEDEKIALQRTADDVDTLDNEQFYTAQLDDTDFDGEKLNEEINATGNDLDVPGAEDDDDNEEIGEEDEENNSYSLGDNE